MKLSKSLFPGVLFLAVTGGIVWTSFGQQRRMQQKQKQTVVEFSGKTYLSGGVVGNLDTVSAAAFRQLINSPLEVKDSMGHSYKASSYNFLYVSREVYSDSTGQPVVMSDYYSSSAQGGLLPDFWLKGLYPLIKEGDTAIFTDVRFHGAIPEGKKFAPTLNGTPLKVVLTP